MAWAVWLRFSILAPWILQAVAMTSWTQRPVPPSANSPTPLVPQVNAGPYSMVALWPSYSMLALPLPVALLLPVAQILVAGG